MVLFMPKGKIRVIYQEKFEHKKKIEDNWQAFLNKNTYLVFNKRQQLIETIKKSAIIPRISWFYFKVRKKLKIIKNDLKRLEEVISNYNDIFIKKRLEEYSSFFEGKDDQLKFPLDEDQRLAIIKDDEHNLIVAGAGSGKTSVLTARIAYLIRRKENFLYLFLQ
ncbi:unnamed protein product [marine sediment metagenome]|uniref:UvrD-like helicase ATP-binding domain-containing protein n=1 Tax=marine sediment metagenome TaxID=412755 RepID=X1B493_9ZZZZ